MKFISDPKNIIFVEERVGLEENKLKQTLLELFLNAEEIHRVYLVQVKSEKENFTSLCFRTSSNEMDEGFLNRIKPVVESCDTSFMDLKIINITEDQEEQLRKVCCPFYTKKGCQVKKPDFYLGDGDCTDEFRLTRACYKFKKLIGPNKDGYMIVDILPTVLMYGKECNKVILATRTKGVSIFKIEEWPAYVHVAQLVNNLDKKFSVKKNETSSYDWAVIYPSPPNSA